jgi:hypothetical protein
MELRFAIREGRRIVRAAASWAPTVRKILK